MRLAEDRITDQDSEPGINRTTDAPVTVTPPMVVMQRTEKRSLKRYKPLKTSIISQSEHTIKMSNGAVLRKSGVALKVTRTPKKRAPNRIANTLGPEMEIASSQQTFQLKRHHRHLQRHRRKSETSNHGERGYFRIRRGRRCTIGGDTDSKPKRDIKDNKRDRATWE